MDFCNTAISYESKGIMTRIGVTIVAPLFTLFLSLTSSEKTSFTLILLALIFSFLVRFTLVPLKEADKTESERDSREILSLLALWLGWITQSILADYGDIQVGSIIEFLRSFVLIVVACFAWHIELSGKWIQVQRFLLAVFWISIAPPVTQYGFLTTSPIVSVLRVLLLFGAATIVDMKKKKITILPTSISSETKQEQEEEKQQQQQQQQQEPIPFIPIYVMIFGWVLFVPPLFWTAFVLLICVSIYNLKGLMMGASSGTELLHHAQTSSSSSEVIHSKPTSLKMKPKRLSRQNDSIYGKEEKYRKRRGRLNRKPESYTPSPSPALDHHQHYHPSHPYPPPQSYPPSYYHHLPEETNSQPLPIIPSSPPPTVPPPPSSVSTPAPISNVQPISSPPAPIQPVQPPQQQLSNISPLQLYANKKFNSKTKKETKTQSQNSPSSSSSSSYSSPNL